MKLDPGDDNAHISNNCRPFSLTFLLIFTNSRVGMCALQILIIIIYYYYYAFEVSSLDIDTHNSEMLTLQQPFGQPQICVWNFMYLLF